MKKFFCPAPWRSLFYHVNKSSVCCISTKRFEQSPIEFLNSDYLKELKTKFLNGEYDETCSGCKALEDAGLQSIRQHLLDMYGESTEENIDYMELRASNLCNFECRMCNAENSSLINKGVVTVTDVNWSEILSLAENVKVLTLTGGEPMLIKHYYQLLDHLITKGKTDIELRVYTNGSVYNPVFVEKLLKFKTSLNLSIDAVGKAAELQRVGTVWPTVADNVSKFIKLPFHIKFHSTFTIISIIDVHSLAKYFVDISTQRAGCMFVAHTALSLDNLYIGNTPAALVPKALSSISQAIELLDDSRFDQVKSQLESYQKLLSKST